MFEQFVLGAIQGIAEWLPISSEGLIFLVKTNFFNTGESLMNIAQQALFLHFGTFLAALIYFRKDVLILSKTLINYKSASCENKKELVFIIVATLISGFFGFYLLLIADNNFNYTSNIINFTIGILLLITAFFQIKAKNIGIRNIKDLKKRDGIILGIAQGFAVLPGLSRSGLTISALLLRKFGNKESLRLSFLLSMPIVLGGNIILNLDKFSLSVYSLIGLFTSFVFGLITIGILLRLAKKVNFGYFVLGFGLLMILLALI